MTGSNENVGNSIQTSQYDTPNNTVYGECFRTNDTNNQRQCFKRRKCWQVE